MSRYRLIASAAQEVVLRDHRAQARFVWNLAVEQHRHWRPGRKSAPGYLEQCRQLTATRAEHPWLAAGSQMVQQQALRDFARAMAGPRYAGIEPPRPGEARDRPPVGPGDGPAQGLDGEDQHGHRAAVRRDPGRGPAHLGHDPVGSGDR